MSGCEYCMEGHVKWLHPDRYSTSREIEDVRLALNPGFDQWDGSYTGEPSLYLNLDTEICGHRIEDECDYPINFCPMCGRPLRDLSEEA